MNNHGRITQSEIEIIATKAFQEGVSYAIVGRDSGSTESERIAITAGIVRDELEKAGALVQQKRRAIVELDEDDRERHLNLINNYLPANYTAELVAHPKEVKAYILIKGYDRAGWTLDGYVIPRLASGLIVAKEVK
jgi:hypothetical protein